MQIELEIKQKSFKSEYHKLTVNLMYTGHWLQLKNHNHLKQFGLTVQQYNVLRILKGQHPSPVTVSLVIDRMLDKMSNASRLIEKLRKKGLVERRVCEKDRRAVDVLISPKGLNLLKHIENFDHQWENIFKNLSTSEAKNLNELLNKLRG
jgi:DNA-binding MarR family transcriptional regulator